MKELEALRILADLICRVSGYASIEGMTLETLNEPTEVSYYVHALLRSGKIFDVWFFEDKQAFEVHEDTGCEFLMPLSVITDIADAQK